MSYIVFARKWRPQNFDDVVGQDKVITILKNSLRANRLAHAYIFSGPRGVGKTSTARILAKSLNCQKGPSVSPCNKCPSCLDITEGRSLDVIEIDGASNRGIDEIRTLRENVKFAPTQGRYKIYIIDEVHMLTAEAFNALLKTLEEPPLHVKFIFATTHPQKIPPTIISRCQTLEFRRVSTLTIIEKLRDIAKAEHITVGDNVLLAIAKASEGSLRDAESFLDELVSFVEGGDIRIEDANSVLGAVEQEFLFEITDKIIKKDAIGCIDLLNEFIDQGKDPGQLLLGLVEHFRNLMIVKATSKNLEKLLDLPKENCEAIIKQSKNLTLDNIFFSFSVLLNAQEMARRIENLRIPLEVALVKLSSLAKASEELAQAEPLKKIEPVLEVKKDSQEPGRCGKDGNGHHSESRNDTALRQERDSGDEGGFKKASYENVDSDKEINISLDEIKGLWPQFVERLSRVKVSAVHYLEPGHPIRSSGAVLTIGFPKSAAFQKEAMERKENLLISEKIWRDLLNQNIKISFELTNEENQAAPLAEEVDPLVQSASDKFNGRIIRRSPN